MMRQEDLLQATSVGEPDVGVVSCGDAGAGTGVVGLAAGPSVGAAKEVLA